MTKEEQEVLNAVHDGAGVDLTPEQLAEVLADPHVKKEMAIGGVDTVTCEALMDFLSQKILGRPWPTYGDGPNDEFFRAFEEAAPQKGYKLRPTSAGGAPVLI